MTKIARNHVVDFKKLFIKKMVVNLQQEIMDYKEQKENM